MTEHDLLVFLIWAVLGIGGALIALLTWMAKMLWAKLGKLEEDVMEKLDKFKTDFVAKLEKLEEDARFYRHKFINDFGKVQLDINDVKNQASRIDDRLKVIEGDRERRNWRRDNNKPES